MAVSGTLGKWGSRRARAYRACIAAVIWNELHGMATGPRRTCMHLSDQNDHGSWEQQESQ
jgi:hypothetical protein